MSKIRKVIRPLNLNSKEEFANYYLYDECNSQTCAFSTGGGGSGCDSLNGVCRTFVSAPDPTQCGTNYCSVYTSPSICNDCNTLAGITPQCTEACVAQVDSNCHQLCEIHVMYN